MPEPMDRATFLRQVADAVDLQPAQVGEALEELNSHLSDAAAGWREAGLDMDVAERRALRGLGDPQTLGRELGRARHERRQLLAMVGGGMWSAFTFGIWSFLFVWIVFGGLGLLVTLGAMAVLEGLRIETGNWLSGQAGSLVTVTLTTLWFAWMGWVLPQRVARAAGRSVRGVQREVGIAGFGIGGVMLWMVPSLAMDPVLALGLPLGPVAFLVAAQRPCRGADPFPATSLRSRLGIALAIAVVTVTIGLVTMGKTTPMQQGFGFDVNAIGASEFEGLPGSDTLPSATFFVAPGETPTVTASAWFPDDAWLAAFEARYPTTALEVWPLVPTATQTYTAGPAPLVAQSFASTPEAFANGISIPMPMPRTPQLVAIALVAVGADGSRVVVMPDAQMTPTWHGTLFDWWFGPR